MTKNSLTISKESKNTALSITNKDKGADGTFADPGTFARPGTFGTPRVEITKESKNTALSITNE